MNKIVVSLMSDGKYLVFYGGHKEADGEMRVIYKRLKPDEEYIREITRIEVNEIDLVCWNNE